MTVFTNIDQLNINIFHKGRNLLTCNMSQVYSHSCLSVHLPYNKLLAKSPAILDSFFTQGSQYHKNSGRVGSHGVVGVSN